MNVSLIYFFPLVLIENLFLVKINKKLSKNKKYNKLILITFCQPDIFFMNHPRKKIKQKLKQLLTGTIIKTNEYYDD